MANAKATLQLAWTQTCAALLTCRENAGSRAPLGECRVTRADSAAISYRYRFATVFEDDSSMQDCFETGGKWSSVARDSPEFQEANLRNAGRVTQKNADVARKLLKQDTPESDRPHLNARPFCTPGAGRLPTGVQAARADLIDPTERSASTRVGSSPE